MHTLEQQLRGFCHPACEAMPDAARLTNLVRLGGEAADRISELEAENKLLREANDALSAMLKPVE